MRTTNCLSLGLLLILTACASDASRKGGVAATVSARSLPTHERVLLELPDPSSLRRYHDLFSSEPHIAGTPGDKRMIQTLVREFTELGLEVQVHRFRALLPQPVSASLQIVSAPSSTGPLPLALDLPIRELPLDEDPDTSLLDLSIGFNAYSASGDVTAEVVYANHGTKEDFAKLRELDIDVTGKIVLARYGGNFRGYKVKFAEQAGAVGVILFTDPEDSGYKKGQVYPRGGWANEHYVQRGSINTLPYPGDPLTPGIEASIDAPRLPLDSVALPKILCQPIGYGAAEQILRRMDGPTAPTGWQGGLPCEYRLTGGPELKVRLQVEQTRSILETANVLATLRGSRFPDQKIYVGCHHDAWSFGAGDPNSGSILVYEAAKCFAEAAKRGWRPKRSIVFCNWGAEEYGIIGSTEWVEANRQDLSRNGVAYINLDMATMGSNFSATCSPLLQRVIEEATRFVPQAYATAGESVFDAWRGRSAATLDFGTLGGGSDHVGFLCHVGVASASLGAGGCEGVSYHSNYETLHWWRQVVGNDYEPAVMLTRIVNLVAARLADEPLLPLDATAYAPALRSTLVAAQERASAVSLEADREIRDLIRAVDGLGITASKTNQSLVRAQQSGRLTAADDARINDLLLRLERCWIGRGLSGRPWYRSLLAAPDPDSGYAAWVLPGLQQAIQSGNSQSITQAAREVQTALSAVSELLSVIDVVAWTAAQRVMRQ